MDIVGPFPTGQAHKRFILIAVDYFTMWVEAKALATVIARQVQNFFWKIICRSGLPRIVITDNGRQFIDKKLRAFYQGLGLRHVTSSVEHPQTNDQAEATNKIIVAELKRKLSDNKWAWVDELPKILWAYRCTPHDTTDETSFNLTYGTNAILPVEIGEPSLRRQVEDLQMNDNELRIELDTLDEKRHREVLQAEACRRMVERKYNMQVRPRNFQEGDLVWRKTGDARKVVSHGKLAAKWDRPFKVEKDLRNGAYRLSSPDGKPIPNTWNATHLKFYFS